MPVPFFVFLKKTHTVQKYSSYDAENSHAAKHLQSLLDAEKLIEYSKQLDAYKAQGLMFRLCENKVYETRNEGEAIEVRVALQVRGSVINWYFWAPDSKDQFSQEFRDELYLAASQSHKKVKNGCDLYYRGSDAFHIKTMHHLETEAGHNHNHYRVLTPSVSVEDLTQHLQGLKEYPIHEKFFVSGEIDELCKKYYEFHQRWTQINDGGKSAEDIYEDDHQLNEADIIEFQLFGLCQEPCRIKTSELQFDYEQARLLINQRINSSDSSSTSSLEDEVNKLKSEYQVLLEFRQGGSGSRALNSEIAMTRQPKDTSRSTTSLIVETLSAPPVPEWAKSVCKEVERVKASVGERLSKSEARTKPLSLTSHIFMRSTSAPELNPSESSKAAATPRLHFVSEHE